MTSPCAPCGTGDHGDCAGPLCPCACPWNQPVGEDDEPGCLCLTCYPAPVPAWARDPRTHAPEVPA